MFIQSIELFYMLLLTDQFLNLTIVHQRTHIMIKYKLVFNKVVGTKNSELFFERYLKQ